MACEHGMSLKNIYETEKLILNKISFRVNFCTASDLLRNLIIISGSQDTELYEIASNWINYTLNEFSLFKKYNQFLITTSCLIIALKINELENECEILKNYLKETNELHEFEVCANDIVNSRNEEEITANPEYVQNETTSENTIMSSTDEIVSRMALADITSQVMNLENNTPSNDLLGRKKSNSIRLKKKKASLTICLLKRRKIVKTF